MKQPEQWSRYAERILATGACPHFAPELETLEVHARMIAAERRQLTLMDSAAAVHPVSRTVERFRDGDLTAYVFGKLLRFCCFTDELYDPLERLIDASRVFARIERCHREALLDDEEMAFMNGRRSAIQHTLYPSTEQRAWFERIGHCRVENACAPSDHQHLFDVWVIRRRP